MKFLLIAGGLMMKTRSSVFGSTALSLIFILSAGFGLGFQEERSLQQKTEEADLIVVGKVTKVEARWNDPTLKTMIYTYTTISIEEEIKGSSPEKEITIIAPGGSVDGVGAVFMVPVAHFQTGERVVVFLRRDPHSSLFCVSGGETGKYSIGIDKNAELFGKPLSEFLDKIRQYISN